METLNSNNAVIEKFDDSVVLIEFTSSETVNVTDLNDIEKVVGQLIGNHPYFSISILPLSFKNFSFDAKNYITDENENLNNRIVDCYIASTLAKRIELEVFFQLHKPTRRTKIFSSLNKALTFVEGQKKLEVDKKGVLV